jgi:hypothetical protein
METDFQSLQDENHQLREYILNLQSQLLGQNNKEQQQQQPLSPQQRKRPAATREDAENVSEHDLQSERATAPLSGAAPPPPSGMVGRSAAASDPRAAPVGGDSSWSEHIDNLRQRYGDYPVHRPSGDGEPSSVADAK